MGEFSGEVSSISGPVWLTFDVDGLDGSLFQQQGHRFQGD